MRRPTISRPTAAILAAAMIAAIVAGACAGAAVTRDVTGRSDLGGTVSTESMPQGAPVEQAAEAGGALTADGDVNATVGDPTGPMIIRTGTLQLQVGEVDKAVADAQRVVTAAGGYVAGSDRSFDGDRPVATLTLRIPADTWDATLAELRGLSTKVLSEHTSSVEVTAQVRDLDARITNLRASEAALLKIMDQATRISDILEVQSQLSSVRGEIEQLQSERTHLADQAAQGTLTASFVLAPTPIQTTAQGWDPGAEVANAVAALVEMGQGVASGAIWFAIVILPVLLVGLVILLPIALIVRRAIRRSRKTGADGTPPAPVGPQWGTAA
jgi:hypothetical protein